MASEMVFRLEPKFMKTGEPFSQFSKEEVDQVRDTKYDELCENFLDIVFEFES